MKFKSFKALAVAATLLSAGSASAVTLNVGSGWNAFAFGAVGTMAKRSFTFTLTGYALMSVVDGFVSGDRFQVLVNNTSFGVTSVPVNGASSVGANYALAATNPNFSSWTHRFGPGTYSLAFLIKARSGTNTIDHLAAVRLDAAPVPVPAAGLMLISALGAAGALRRRRKQAK